MSRRAIEPGDVASPCIEVCVLDVAGRVCTGCYRTVGEIAAWGNLSNAQRARVIAALAARRDGLGAPPPAAGTIVRCTDCGAPFGCGAMEPHNACWCTKYPPVAPRAGVASCLCPRCLAAAN